MTIAYVTDTGNVIGGGEISLLLLLANMDRSRFTPLLLSPEDGDFTGRAREADVPVDVVPYVPLRSPAGILEMRRTLMRLRRLLRERRIRLLHLNSSGGFPLLTAWAAVLEKIPVIWHVREVNVCVPLDTLLYGLSTHVICISRWVALRRLGYLGGQKVTVIYNAVDTQRFVSSDERDGREVIHVGALGRYVSWKGYEHLIRAAELLRDRNIRFSVVGLDYSDDNEYVRRLKRMIAERNLNGRVALCGRHEHPEHFFSNIDIFCFPSLREPMGRAVIEAMSCGVPVVAFKAGGVPELMNEETGILVPSGDYRKLAEAIGRLCDDGDLRRRMGQGAGFHAGRSFAISVHMRRISDLYEKVLS